MIHHFDAAGILTKLLVDPEQMPKFIEALQEQWGCAHFQSLVRRAVVMAAMLSAADVKQNLSGNPSAEKRESAEALSAWTRTFICSLDVAYKRNDVVVTPDLLGKIEGATKDRPVGDDGSVDGGLNIEGTDQ